jgi:hypothetical protein
MLFLTGVFLWAKIDPIDEVVPLPPEVTYQESKQKIIQDKKNIEHLAAYTRRENKLALVGRMMDLEKKKKPQKEVEVIEEGGEEEPVVFYGVEPEKKNKFDLINYL